MNLHELLAPEVEWTKSDWYIQYFTKAPIKKPTLDLQYLKEINSKYYLNFHRALVEEVDASNSRINAEGLAILSCFKQIKSIKLVQCQSIDDHSLAHIATLEQLQSLDLSKTVKISPIGLAYLQNLTSLRVLNLSSTKISNNGIDPLQNLPIEELNLSRTNVTDEIIAMLHASNLRSSLTRLYLSGNKLGAKLDVLIQLTEFPRLLHLNLVGTSVNSSAIAKLRDEFKRVEGVTGVKVQGNIIDITRVLQPLKSQSSSAKQLIESKEFVKFVEINQSAVDKKPHANNANTFTSHWIADKENVVNGAETRVSPVKQPLEHIAFVEYKKTSPVKSTTGTVVSHAPSVEAPLNELLQPVSRPFPARTRYDELVEVKRALFTEEIGSAASIPDPLFDEDIRLDTPAKQPLQSPARSTKIRREERDRPLSSIKSLAVASPSKAHQTPPRTLQSTPQHAQAGHAPLASPLNLSQDIYITPPESLSPSKGSPSLYYSFSMHNDESDVILIESSTEMGPSPRRSAKKKRTPVRRVLTTPGTKRSLSTMLEDAECSPYAVSKKRRPLAPLPAAQANQNTLARMVPVPSVPQHVPASEFQSIGDLCRKGRTRAEGSQNSWIDKVLHIVHYK